MKKLTLISGLMLFTALLNSSVAMAVGCPEIRRKAAETKNSKPSACVLVEHTIGVSPGSSVSVYQCGAKKYELTTQKNDNCVAKEVK